MGNLPGVLPGAPRACPALTESEVKPWVDGPCWEPTLESSGTHSKALLI